MRALLLSLLFIGQISAAAEIVLHQTPFARLVGDSISAERSFEVDLETMYFYNSQAYELSQALTALGIKNSSSYAKARFVMSTCESAAMDPELLRCHGNDRLILTGNYGSLDIVVHGKAMSGLHIDRLRRFCGSVQDQVGYTVTPSYELVFFGDYFTVNETLINGYEVPATEAAQLALTQYIATLVEQINSLETPSSCTYYSNHP